MQKSIYNTFGVNSLTVQNDETVGGNEFIAGTSTNNNLVVTGNTQLGTDYTSTCTIPSSTTIGQNTNTITRINGAVECGNGTGIVNVNGTGVNITGPIIAPNPVKFGTAGISGDSYIYGNITLGDQNNGGKVYMLGENTIGITKPTAINGTNGVTINTNTSYGGDTTIGRLTKNVNMMGTLNLGDSSGNGVVNVTCPINSTSTITAGKALNQASSSTIVGNVSLGDTGWGTQVSLNGQVAVGSNTQRVVIGGAPLDINTGAGSGNITVGNGVNSTTFVGNTTFGDSSGNDITTIVGTLNVGNTTILTGNTTIGDSSGNNITQVNGTFYVGNGTKQIAMTGSQLNLQTNAGSGSTQVGMSGQTSGQTNVFLSSENRLFNPKVCNNTGVVTSQSFCLNSPSFCSFNQGVAFNSSTNTFTLPDLTSRTAFLNLPNLPNYGLYAVTIEYTLNILMGTLSGVNGQSGVKIVPYTKAMNGTDTNTSRGRYCYGQFILFINRDPANSTAPFTYSHYLLNGLPANPFTTVSFTYISQGTTSTTANFQPLTISSITGVTQSSSKIRMQMNLPNVAQTIATGDFVICATGSFSVLSSVSNNFDCAPNTTANGFGGEAWFSLS
jgi:hypothetical protein